MSGPPAFEDPGSPQSSTSTVNVTDPIALLCVAMPVNFAWLPVGFVGQAELGLLITNVLMDVALMRTFAALWSLYSRLPFGSQHVTAKLKVACPPTTLIFPPR
ncbi:MAG: hypothetical protein E6K61_08120 [Nitrospirae bacterium]|nr:MAG: hypothetical protein E6K61_08120 [Nitrospirota bacterium]